MRPKRVDENQPEIVRQLRKIPGISVTHTHMIGDGMPDIVVGVQWSKRNYLFEIKDPSKPPSRRKLTEDEEKFHKEWKGQIDTVESVTDILKIINA